MARSGTSTSFLGNLVATIGQPCDQKDIDAGYSIVRKRKLDELHTEKCLYLQRNVPISTDVGLKRRKEIQRVETQVQREVIQLEGDTEISTFSLNTRILMAFSISTTS